MLQWFPVKTTSKIQTVSICCNGLKVTDVNRRKHPVKRQIVVQSRAVSVGSIQPNYQTILIFGDLSPFSNSIVNKVICVTSSKFVLTGLSHRFKCQELITFTVWSWTDALQGHIPAWGEVIHLTAAASA